MESMIRNINAYGSYLVCSLSETDTSSSGENIADNHLDGLLGLWNNVSKSSESFTMTSDITGETLLSITQTGDINGKVCMKMWPIL
jgi:hypothetical protein